MCLPNQVDRPPKELLLDLKVALLLLFLWPELQLFFLHQAPLVKALLNQLLFLPMVPPLS